MPYTHRKVGNKQCVFKKSDGTKVGCTKGDINKYLAALYTNTDINESENKEDSSVDTIIMDIPLFIRMLEYAREDAKTDMDLHVATENANKLTKQFGSLTMEQYDSIIGGESKNTTTDDNIKGGLADGKTMEDIAKLHKVSIGAIKKEYQKGMKVELEHTSDKKIAAEIARDHLVEDPEYYTNLAKIEKNENSIKEDVEPIITDENPDTMTVLIKYNSRKAGVIMVSNAKIKNTLEIVGIKFFEGYETLNIISQSINSLWAIFKDTNSIIVAPELESVEIWNKLGFSRISKHYLISNRGH